VDGVTVLRLLCPLRLSMRALAFRWGLPDLLPTRLPIPHEGSRVPPGRLKRNAVGGVGLLAPSALCGFSVSLQGRSGFPGVPLPYLLWLWPLRWSRSNHFGHACLASQTRSARGALSVGRIRARCLSVRLPNPPVRTVLAAFIAHGSREKDVYRECPFRQLHGVHRGQRARSLTTCVLFPYPLPQGLRHVCSFPTCGLLCPI
jgi:hypothetical protein